MKRVPRIETKSVECREKWLCPPFLGINLERGASDRGVTVGVIEIKEGIEINVVIEGRAA